MKQAIGIADAWTAFPVIEEDFGMTGTATTVVLCFNWSFFSLFILDAPVGSEQCQHWLVGLNHALMDQWLVHKLDAIICEMGGGVYDTTVPFLWGG
jgi:hypothetical protein